MRTVEPEQALAYRIAGHNLHRRTDPLAAIAACGIQESPPGWWGVALRARSTKCPDARSIVIVNAMRGAPHVVPRTDVAVFTRALVPDDEGLRVPLGSAVIKEVRAGGIEPREALELVAAAAREGLEPGPLGRDDFHQALRERLPEPLLPWCRGCRSHHVRPGLWRTLGWIGVTEIPERATYALARPTRMSLTRARAELARRFLRCFGPATHSQLASWAQTAPEHAKQLLAAIADELEEVKLGKRTAWALAAEGRRLGSPPKAKGVRLLGAFDPYVSQPDRETFVPDPMLRKRMFPSIGRPGVILRDGEMVGLWRARKKGEALQIEVDPLHGQVDVAAEATAVAHLRGCERAEILA